MSISDRVCPEHGDIGALPNANFCPQCGKALEMKSVLRASGENVVLGAGLGLGVGLGVNAADALSDGISDLLG